MEEEASERGEMRAVILCSVNSKIIVVVVVGVYAYVTVKNDKINEFRRIT